MPTINYQTSFARFDERRRVHRRWFIRIAIAVVVLILLVVVPILSIFVLYEYEYTKFSNRTKDSDLMGKTAQQVINHLGPPMYDTANDPPGYHAIGERHMYFNSVPDKAARLTSITEK